MAKFPRVSKLSKKEREELILEFCEAFVAIKNLEEAASFLKDLLGRQEIEMLAKRLRIAKLLLEGKKYGEIQEELRVSHGTIARVNLWLETSGEGYRLVAKRTKKREKSEVELMVGETLNRYLRSRSSYYWPYFLWKELVKNLGKRKRKRLQEILARGEDKGKIYKEFNELLREVYRKKKRSPEFMKS